MEKKLKHLKTFEQCTDKNLNISDVSERLSSTKKKDVYGLYEEIYSKVKEHYKTKKESFVEAKVDDIITIIWRHYDYKPSKEQLKIEIQNQLS
jgi:hypothetical protein